MVIGLFVWVWGCCFCFVWFFCKKHKNTHYSYFVKFLYTLFYSVLIIVIIHLLSLLRVDKHGRLWLSCMLQPFPSALQRVDTYRYLLFSGIFLYPSENAVTLNNIIVGFLFFFFLVGGHNFFL